MGDWSVVEEPKQAAPAASDWTVTPDKPVEKPSFLDEVSSRIGDTLSRLKNVPTLGEVGESFTNLGKTALAANDFVGRAIVHPIDTFGGGKAAPVLRETLRGVNSNIPFANLAVEHLGGPAEVSPQDAAAAPGAQPFGALLGTPVAGAEAGIGLSLADRGASTLGRALGGVTKEAAAERQVTRAVEDLGEKTKKRTRAGVESEPVEALVRETPELRKAAGNDAKVAETIEKTRQAAAAELNSVYQSAPQEVSPANAIANMDTKIAELSKGTSEQREVARSLKTIRDEFHEAHGEKSAVTPQELRAEQSAYQKKGYGKAMPGDDAASARIEANRVASKAVGDAVVRHVTGMGYEEAKAAAKTDPGSTAARLFKANEQINAVNKLETAISERAAQQQPKEGIVGKAQKVAHVISHPTSIIPAAADTAARAVDAGIVKRGISADAPVLRFLQAAKQGNPFAQRQLKLLAATPVGAARLAAAQAQLQGANP